MTLEEVAFANGNEMRNLSNSQDILLKSTYEISVASLKIFDAVKEWEWEPMQTFFGFQCAVGPFCHTTLRLFDSTDTSSSKKNLATIRFSFLFTGSR